MRRLLAVATVLALAAGGCTGDDPTSATKATDDLEVVSWWTSGSEAAALDTLLAAFRQENPGVEPVNAAVAGGAGSAAIVALARRLRRDDPPDVWQTFAGRAVQGYADRGVVRDVESVPAGSTHPTILRALTHDGRRYGVPTGAHRGNVLWFNPSVLAEAGVAPPSGGYDLGAFLGDLRRLRGAGVTPLCLGARDPFTTVELFENVLLSVVGVDGWRNLTGDSLDWRGTRVRDALRSFGELLDHADPQAGGLTWDAAMKKLATGGCAYASMNDSAYGELAAASTDFGAVPFPGTGGGFLAVVDVFVAATRADNARNALAFLSVINRPAVQAAFSRAKGSVPVVRDVDVSSLPAYQRAASADLWNLPVLMSVTHGQAMSPEFQEGFYDAVRIFERTRDPDSFADALEDAVARDRVPPR